MAYKSIRIKEETYEGLKRLSSGWGLSLDETVGKLLNNRTPSRPPQAPPKENGLPFTSEQVAYLEENFMGIQAKEIEGMRLEQIEGRAPVEPDWATHRRRAEEELPKEMQEALEYCQDPDTRRNIEKEFKEKIAGHWAMYHSLKPTREA